MKTADAFLFAVRLTEAGVIALFARVHAAAGLLDRAALTAFFALPMRAVWLA